MKKKYRIKKNEEFTSIIEKKNCVSNSAYTMFFDAKKEDYSRIGISVSKKLGNAPIRNKIKRQVRMMFIENYDYENMPSDLIVIIRPKYLENSYSDNLAYLEKLIKKAIIKKTTQGADYE